MKTESIEEILKRIGRQNVPADVQTMAEKTAESFTETLMPSRQHILGRTIMKSRMTRYAAAAVIIIGVMVGLDSMNGSPDGAGIVWAEVLEAFNNHLHENDYIHLLIIERNYLSDHQDVAPGDIIHKQEIWIKRPGKMRSEETWQIINDPGHIQLVPSTTIYNDKGTYGMNHDSKTWRFVSSDLISPRHKETFRERAHRHVEHYLQARFYGKYDWNQKSYLPTSGRLVGMVEQDGEMIDLYEFSEMEGKKHKCWLGHENKRLYRMEVFAEEMNKPETIYEINYEVPPHDSFFEPVIPEDYRNMGILGYEDQPHVMNPDVVAMERDDESVRFYRLDQQPGQTRQAAIETAKEAGPAALEVNLQNRQPKMTVKAVHPENLQIDSWYTLGGGGHSVGVLLEDRIEHMLYFRFDNEGSILYEIVQFRTDFNFCKVAFDADGDGQMDAWYQIPSDEVVAQWRESLGEK
jgi:hypothetical protein